MYFEMKYFLPILTKLTRFDIPLGDKMDLLEIFKMIYTDYTILIDTV